MGSLPLKFSCWENRKHYKAICSNLMASLMLLWGMKSQTMHGDIMSVIFREGHMTKQYDKHLTVSFFWHSHTSTSYSHPNALYFSIQWGHRNHRGSCGIKCGTTCSEINGGKPLSVIRVERVSVFVILVLCPADDCSGSPHVWFPPLCSMVSQSFPWWQWGPLLTQS